MLNDGKPVKKNCLHCGKPLKAIGTARKNGKEYHKKCWKDRIFSKIFLSFWLN